MKAYDYKDVELVAHHDKGMGKLVVYALLDGVEVPIAAHKFGHFGHKLEDGRTARLEAEALKADAFAAPTTEQPPAPHSVTEPSPTATSPTPSPTQ